MSPLSSIVKVLLAVLVWVLAAAPVQAVEVQDLYQASVPVSDRSNTERTKAVRQGLQAVLVKVSGSSRISNESGVREVLQQAERYVVQYGYQTRELPAVEEGGRPQKGVFLNVSYDPVVVNQVLRRSGLPIWASNRPAVTLWLAYDAGRGRQLVGGTSQSNLQALIQEYANRRGLPIVFPQYDQQDRSSVRAGDIWGMFMEPMMDASARYDANVVAALKLSQSSSRVDGNTTLMLDGERQAWGVFADSMEEAISQWVDQLADRVGEHYAVAFSQALGQQVLLDVVGVDGIQDYAGLNDYLGKLIAVRVSYPQQVKGDRVQILVSLESDQTALEQSFRVDRKLIPTDPPKPVKPQTPVPVSVQDSAPDAAQNTAQVPPGAAKPGQVGDMRVAPIARDAAPADPGYPVIYYQWRGQ